MRIILFLLKEEIFLIISFLFDLLCKIWKIGKMWNISYLQYQQLDNTENVSEYFLPVIFPPEILHCIKITIINHIIWCLPWLSWCTQLGFPTLQQPLCKQNWQDTIICHQKKEIFSGKILWWIILSRQWLS